MGGLTTESTAFKINCFVVFIVIPVLIYLNLTYTLHTIVIKKANTETKLKQMQNKQFSQ